MQPRVHAVDPVEARRWPGEDELVAGRGGVAMEHLDGVQRELVRSFPRRRQLLQQVVGDGDDVAADLSACTMLKISRGLAQISSSCGYGRMIASASLHDRHRVDAGIGDAAGEDRNVGAGLPSAPPTIVAT